MSFMDKFNQVADKTLMPIANKIAKQPHLSALRDGMVASIPLSIIGGMCLIVATPPFTPEQLPKGGFFTSILMGWYNWAQANGPALKLPFNMTMGLMGLFICFGIAYHLAQHYKIAPLDASIVSTAVFLLVSSPVSRYVAVDSLVDKMSLADLEPLGTAAMPVGFLDAKGIFTAIIISFGCVEIMNFLLKRNIKFKMPDGVPPAIASSFDAILPLFLCIVIFYGGSLVVQHFSEGELIPSVIMTLLAPAMSGLDSLFGICLIVFIAQVFWFFGLHGASITQFVRLPFMGAYIIANAQAFELGESLPHFFTQPFWSYMIAIGGSGSTLGLAILLTFRSKSVQLKQLGKISILPAIFNINEPIIFGMPLVLNPIMMVPFIFIPIINAVIAYTCMFFGVVGKGIVETPWTTPAPVGAALGTMDIRTGIMVIGLIILDIALYYPFFKVTDRQRLAEEVGNTLTEMG